MEVGERVIVEVFTDFPRKGTVIRKLEDSVEVAFDIDNKIEIVKNCFVSEVV